MLLRERIFAAVLALGAVGASLPAQADAIDLRPFKATYTAEWKGMTAGTTVLELRSAGPDRYSYSSTSNARGVFRMAFSETLTQTSTFRVTDGQVQPVMFRGVDEKDREIRLDFDWAAKRVTGVAKGRPVDLPLNDGAQDAMSLQISMLRNVAAGKAPPTVSLIDSDKLKDYELQLEGNARLRTELGELDTVIYTTRRAGADRMTRTWVAPALGYLPVRAERIRGRKTEFTLLIQSVDR